MHQRNLHSFLYNLLTAHIASDPKCAPVSLDSALLGWQLDPAHPVFSLAAMLGANICFTFHLKTLLQIQEFRSTIDFNYD